MNIAQAQTRAKVEAQFAVRKAMESGSNYAVIDLHSGLLLAFTDRDYLASKDGQAARDRAFGINRGE